MAITENEAIGRLMQLWGMYKRTDPKMGEALDMAIKRLSLNSSENEDRLRTFLEAVQAAPPGKIAGGTVLESICPGCAKRNKLADAALRGEPVEIIDEICPVED